MAVKKIIPYINAENETAQSVLKLAVSYEQNGADELFIYNYCKDEKSRERFLSLVKETVKEVDLPVLIGLYVKRFEDVKKALYTGAQFVVIKNQILESKEALEEAANRFGSEKLIIELDASSECSFLEQYKNYGILLKHVELTPDLTELLTRQMCKLIIRDCLIRNDIFDLMNLQSVQAISTNHYENKDILKVKRALKDQGIKMNTFEPSLSFSDFKLNQDGLIPVIVQDYQTNEVLMLAYMNEESYQKTIETGRMTYFSRSRQQLWIKGDTSGHYQFVKSLTIDCDNDTILAKVKQIGAACHTGNRTCFFTELVKREYDQTNPLTVLEEIYSVIMDRKLHPKEGSYTNYLFDKGIDKILKKCGEEAAEIIIAAKNPDAEELKYEISDFMYHLMVLMADCNLDWNDVMKELAHRR